MIRKIHWSAVLVLTLAWPCAAQTPTITMQLRPVEQLLADAEYFGRLLGQGTDLDRVTETVKKLLTLPGIDTKRHLGAYWHFGEQPEPMDIVFVVPYQDEAKLLEQAATLGVKSAKEKDGGYVLSSERLPSDLHVRFHNKYAYATFRGKEAVAAEKLVDPARIFDKDAKPLFVATVRIEQIPRELRQAAMQTFDQLEGLFQEDNPPPGLTKEQGAMMAQYVRLVTRIYRKMLFQTDTVEANIDIDRAKNVFSLGYRVHPLPRTELARDFVELAKVKTRFGGLVRNDAIASGYACFPYPPELKKIMELAQGQMKLQDLFKDEKQAKAMADFVAKSQKMQGDRLDTGFALTMNKNKKLALIAGSQVENGAALDAEYKKLIETLYPDKAKNWLNAAKAGDVAIHKNRMMDKKMFEELGAAGPLAKVLDFITENPAYNAYRDKEAYWSVGETALESLQATLRQPAEEKESGLYLQASVGRIVELFDVGGMAARKAFADDPEAGRVSYALLTGDGVRFEVKMNASVVKFLILLQKSRREF